MNLKNLRKSKSAIIAIITAFSVISAYLLLNIGVFQLLHLKTINTLFNLRGPISPVDSSIVIVAIDDQSYASLPNKYPYPRFYYGKLVKNLKQAGAKLVVFDIEFTEEDPDNIDDDLYLAREVTDAKNVILAGKIITESGGNKASLVEAVKPMAPLLRTQAPWGVVNAITDDDGFIRRYMLFYDTYESRKYTIAVEAAKFLENIKNIDKHDFREPTLQIGNLLIKKESGNTMYINFLGPAGTIPTYSLANVLDDSTFDLPGDEDMDIFEYHKEWGTFKDKIVFVGATTDEIQDNKLTPFLNINGKRQLIPGVEVHANALSTILQNRYLVKINTQIEFLYVVLISILTVILTLAKKAFRAFLLVMLELFVTSGLGYFVFASLGQIPELVLPILSISLSFVVSIVYQTVTEQREKSRIRRTFQHYVSPSVVEKMLATGELPSYGGERKTVTVLFSDIRKFTNFSESHEPETVVTRLSEYLTEMVEVVYKYNGTLDKFVGDEIMALFGAPYALENHAEKACYTAIEMIDSLRVIQRRWSANKEDIFQIGIGINTGKVIVGNLGSSQLFDYTVIGDEVNLGARLEGANKQYGTTILISESTYELVKDKAQVRELDVVRVVGKSKPIRIFELRGMDSIPQIEKDYIIDVFHEGTSYYRERKWSDALKAFRRVLRYFPTDGPSRIYTVRCLDFIENPPPHDWDGVYDFKQK